MFDDTIFALATAPGRAGIAVIRISGPRAAAALSHLTGRPVPPPRRATRVRLCDPDSGEPLDDGIGIYFPAPRSFTGEDVVELHTHGGRASVAALIGALSKRDGLRIAEPGEFSRRAFENGKLDLTEAEAIADLVDAETEAQRRQALRQLDGALGAMYEDWRDRLIRCLAHLEAWLDFPDEGIPPGVISDVDRNMLGLTVEMRRHLDDNRRGERLRDGLYGVILGPPNVGKSSLLNCLARRDAAIVSATAGTTRDVIECHLDLAGYPVTLADTAGLRAAADDLERQGIDRALARAAAADFRIVMADATSPADAEAMGPEILDGESIRVVNKIDLLSAPKRFSLAGRPALGISVATGEGIEELLESLNRWVAERFDSSGAVPLTRARHRVAVEECVAALERGRNESAPELIAEELRLATRSLGRITGRCGVEDILDVVFRDFCIGK